MYHSVCITKLHKINCTLQSMIKTNVCSIRVVLREKMFPQMDNEHHIMWLAKKIKTVSRAHIFVKTAHKINFVWFIFIFEEEKIMCPCVCSPRNNYFVRHFLITLFRNWLSVCSCLRDLQCTQPLKSLLRFCFGIVRMIFKGLRIYFFSHCLRDLQYCAPG